MWRILKATIGYEKVSFLLSCWLPVVVAVVFLIFKWMVGPVGLAKIATLNVAKAFTVIIALLLLRAMIGGGVWQFHYKLPVSLPALGLVRLLYPVGIWGGAMISGLICAPFVASGMPPINILRSIMLINGIILCFHAVVTIARDLALGFHVHKSIGLVPVFFVYVGFFIVLVRFKSELFYLFGLSGVLGLNLAGLALSGLSIAVFTRRKSYVM